MDQFFSKVLEMSYAQHAPPLQRPMQASAALPPPPPNPAEPEIDREKVRESSFGLQVCKERYHTLENNSRLGMMSRSVLC